MHGKERKVCAKEKQKKNKIPDVVSAGGAGGGGG